MKLVTMTKTDPRPCPRCAISMAAKPKSQLFCSRGCARFGGIRAPKKVTPAEERFWKKVDTSGSCWNWLGGKDQDGYGSITLNQSSKVRTHRFSWELANKRPIPEGLWVLHRCDNPSCVNPAHLFLGTSRDNINDMVSKGRARSGERNNLAKLSREQVIAARARGALGESPATISSDLGVNKETIRYILKGKTWKNVS
jgi:hypothetical protein